ncbi:MAG: DUF547 domain-containing protein [Alcanivorax sp.]|nr:DUF547 domain-containing protein [Alcanivorax sp.]UWN50745.1 hypothetical protein ASALC70_02968 [Alcanivorax sp. ALC70]MAY09392.1 DUF547 domain-containing protein [Alcanivorax sp.]MBI55259.1 DUF547 domain-containing protein [Alcanivorax sp.]MBU60405.1 DUF547 domain-containing protein [Alcanivorax sp.]|tara:strand:+ start:27541 stop:28344 length:804 start_codon:yes stop_codon:yes gene_type:complete
MRPSRWLFVLLLVFWASAPAGADAGFDHGAWNTLLQEHVEWRRDGVASVVDYDGFAADRDALRAYLDALGSLSEAGFQRLDRDARLAFLINAYNAFTVELILRQTPRPDSIRDIGSIFRGPWKQRFFTLLGEERTLDELEHEMIRGNPALMDERIHFAVNCASVGCPALRPEAYTGARLDAQLADATHRFLSDRQRNRFRDGTLEVSPIFDWYESDFDAAADGLGAWLANHGDALALPDAARSEARDGDLDIDFLDYDWSLNDGGGR